MGDLELTDGKIVKKNKQTSKPQNIILYEEKVMLKKKNSDT